MARFESYQIIGFEDGTLFMEDTHTVVSSDKDEYYTVMDGDTLLEIAYLKYGNHDNWDLIAKANNIINPFELPTGYRLIIPYNGRR